MSFIPTVLLRGQESGGRISVVSGAVPARWEGPPLHRHEFDETFFVTAGELTFEVAGERVVACAGELAYAPGDVAHTFANLSHEPASYLLVINPAGFERYFARMEAERAGRAVPGWATEPTPPVERLGPPIALD
jgi:quercetin dioxygenase-like cupin family protein